MYGSCRLRSLVGNEHNFSNGECGTFSLNGGFVILQHEARHGFSMRFGSQRVGSNRRGRVRRGTGKQVEPQEPCCHALQHHHVALRYPDRLTLGNAIAVTAAALVLLAFFALGSLIGARALFFVLTLHVGAGA